MGTTRRVLGKSLIGVAFLVAVASAACASGDSGPDLSSAPVARQIVAATGHASTVSTWYSSPVEATPLTTYVIDGEEKPNPVSDLFVVGTVLSVDGGMGYSWPDGPQVAGGEPTEATHGFNHEDAWISTVYVTVSIDSSLYRDAAFASLQEVKIGLALSSPVNLDSLRTELVDQKIAAPLLTHDKTFFRQEPGVYGVLLSGEMLGFVGDDGMVSFPALTSLHHPSSGQHQYSLVDLLNPPTRISLQNVDGEYVKVDTGSKAAADEFPFALWGPWNDGKEPPPTASPLQLEGVVEFDGPCAYMVVDLATYDAYYREQLFGSEPEQYVRVLLVFPDDSPLGRTRWGAAEETVSYEGKERRAGDYFTVGNWYYSRYDDLDRRLPLRWGQAGKNVIQKWDDSCDARFVLGL